MAETAFAAPSSSSSFDAMLQPSQEELDKTIESMREKSDAISERATSVADTIAANRAAAAELKMPELRELPEAPTPEMRDPLEAFGSTASMLGILGSMFTRRPLTHALNAAAGTMNAYRANDLQSAKFQFETWKTNMENVKTLHDWEMDQYKGAMDKLSTDTKAAMTELEALGYTLKNENLVALVQSRNTSAISKWYETMRALGIKSDGMMPTLEAGNLWEQWKLENPNATHDEKLAAFQKHFPKQAPSGAGADPPKLTPESHRRIAEQVLLGNEFAASRGVAFGKAGAADRAAIQNAITELATERNLSPGDMNAAIARFRGLTTMATTEGRRAGQLEIAAEAAFGMADEVSRASKAIPRTSFMPLNQLLSTARENLGSPEVAAFQASINTFINGYARAISPTGVTTVSDKDHARAILSVAQSPEQVEAVLVMLRRELVVEQKAVERAFERLSKQISGDKLEGAVQRKVEESNEMRRLNAYKASLKKDPPKSLEDAQRRYEQFLGGVEASTNVEQRPEPLTLPKDKADLLRGEYYRTPGGDGYWNPETKRFQDEPLE